MSDRPSEEVRDLLAEAHDHLAAIAERPVDPAASPWLAEAEAVVGDVADGDAPTAAVAKRVDQARDLLANVEGTDDREADDNLDSTRDLLAAIDRRLGEGTDRQDGDSS